MYTSDVSTASESISLEYLNHASILVHAGQNRGVRLLFDPWLLGTAFSESWGLRFENNDALEKAATANVLWISHWHSDHFHPPTLQELAKRNPDMRVLANESRNFSMTEKLRGFGFKNVEPFKEREPLQLAPEVSVIRIPTAGIDNMLYVNYGGFTLLNYNDCNLPKKAIDSIVYKLGRVDILLSNYNHASKIYDAKTPDEIREDLHEKLIAKTNAFVAKFLLPFASAHYYRSPYSQEQNKSLIDTKDLVQYAKNEKRLLPWQPGDAVHFVKKGTSIHASIEHRGLTEQIRSEKKHGTSVSFSELLTVANNYCKRLSKEFRGVRGFSKPLCIFVEDHNRTLILDLTKGVSENSNAAPNIRTHSKALLNWMGKPFGDDTFFAGADFALVSHDTTAIRRMTLLGFLSASHLSLWPMMKMAFSKKGMRFFFNRREEIWATTSGLKFRAGESRL